MRRLCALAAAPLAALALAAPAQGALGVSEFDLTVSGPGGQADLRAGSHPFSVSAALALDSHLSESQGAPIEVPDGDLKDLVVAQMPGLIGNPTAVRSCPGAVFFGAGHACPPATQLGVAQFTIGLPEGEEEGKGGRETYTTPIFNLSPPPGVAAKIGFVGGIVPVSIDLELRRSPPYNVIARLSDIANFAPFLDSTVTLWGVPGDPAHDPERAGDADLPETPFLTAPRACGAPLATTYAADSWQRPGALLADGEPDLSDPAWLTGASLTHGAAGPQGFTGCGNLGFSPELSARPSATAAASPSGLDLGLTVDDPGLANPHGLADADIREVRLTLPRGMSANPSAAAGLGTCSEAQLAAEQPGSAPGEGCPGASKLGAVEVETPLLDEDLSGSVYVAEPYRNLAGDSLIALYLVIRNPRLGVIVRQPVRVEPDPGTGQLTAIATEIPQLPFSELRVRLRAGPRAPLIAPPGCEEHTATATFTPYSGAPLADASSFEISTGPGGGPCPAAAPFAPGFSAGTLSNAAGSDSPFAMRLTRTDGEQDISRFSSVLPPGVVGSLAGIPRCPEAGIARARSRSGPEGAREELASPSCPAASQVGRTLAGAGAGDQLTYVPGSLYLAGPVGGAPLSVVGITPALAGPFDAGVVVVREALTLDPLTAQVQVDGRVSDPIPHILKGIPLDLRDLRVLADRPAFTRNATSCEPSLTQATAWGAGTALFPAAESPLGLFARYQAADCARLGFKPRLAIKLRGGTRRGAHPALRAVVTPKRGDANFSRAVVTLPRSAFLEQAHIRTVCTRVQFAAPPGNGAHCPKGARYGRARAFTPLLDGPAAGPVYLRSSNHKLPDLVAALTGPPSAPFAIELSARLDSKGGGIRSAFAGLPDVPVSRFILSMQGGKKGLIVNSRGLCRNRKRNRATAKLRGQNGRLRTLRPVVRAVKCKGKGKKGRGGKGKGRVDSRRRARRG